MKKLLLAILLSCVSLYSIGQNTRRIYVWDATLSMTGKGGENIWGAVKTAIKNDISSIYDKNTEIVIIPFQHCLIEKDVIGPIVADEAGKKQILDYVTSYNISKLWYGPGKCPADSVGKPGTTTMTALYPTLSGVVNKYLAPGKQNIIEFLSDGKSDFADDQEKFDSMITSSSFCNLLSSKNAHLFYFALTESAENSKIKDYVMKEVCSGSLVYIETDAKSSSKGIIVYSMLVELPKGREINVGYEYGKPIKFRLENTSAPEEFRKLGYKLHVQTPENGYIKVNQEVVIEEDLTFTVTPKYLKSKNDMVIEFAGDNAVNIPLMISPTSGMKSYPYSMTKLAAGSDVIMLTLVNSLQNRMEISSEGSKGTFEYFPTWNLWPFSYYTSDEIEINDVLNVSITEDVENLSGLVELVLCDQYGEKVPSDMVELFVDGEKSEDNTLRIEHSRNQTNHMSPETIQIPIQLALTQKAIDSYDDDRSFVYHFVVNKAPKNLHMLNGKKVSSGMSLDDTSITMTVDYKVNKLKVWFVIILIIVLSALAAIIVLVQISVKRFKVTHLIRTFVSVDEDRRSVMSWKAGLNGSTRIIFTSDSKKKQGFLAKLFQGKKSYVYIANLPVEVELIACSKGKVRHLALAGNTDFQANIGGESMDIMILSCTSEAFGTRYVIEYPRG